MNANGFRPGNWIEKDGKQYQISPLGIFCIGKNHKPIRLSEKMILKLGFEKTDDYGDIIYYEPINRGKRRYGICYNHEEWQFLLIAGNEYTVLIHDEDHFQYVHNLQNIWHSLTGQELT